LWQDWVKRRLLLGKQKHRHHNQRQRDNQELPTQFFHENLLLIKERPPPVKPSDRRWPFSP
jgi:hypothetical protein